MQEAANKLANVNRALKAAVQDGHALEIQLAEITEREQTSRHASFHDTLTGLPNRALSNDRLEHGLAQAKRHGWHLSVMFIDLDDFKKVNDAHGHDVGDNLIVGFGGAVPVGGAHEAVLASLHVLSFGNDRAGYKLNPASPSSLTGAMAYLDAEDTTDNLVGMMPVSGAFERSVFWFGNWHTREQALWGDVKGLFR